MFTYRIFEEKKENESTFPHEVVFLNRISTQEPQETKQMIVRDFFSLMETIPNSDDQATIQKFIRYLQGLLRIRNVVPPVVEIMTIVKETKPVLYHGARRAVTKTSNLFMLFQVDMDVDLAHERLEEYL